MNIYRRKRGLEKQSVNSRLGLIYYACFIKATRRTFKYLPRYVCANMTSGLRKEISLVELAMTGG